VRALVFDTIASNTGWGIGACIQLETFLDKKLLMLACRHHVFERILCAVHKQLLRDTSGPENTKFIEFRDSIWKTIITENGFRTLQFCDRFFQTKKEELIDSLKQILSVPGRKNSLPRDDYRECAELLLMILGTTPSRGAHWLKPGAAHHARWMPSILYPAKIFACSTQAGYDRNIVEKLEALCKFNALFYVEKWLRSSVGADAPFNYLQLWHALNDYRKYDSAVSDAAIAALERHLWYLTEECAVFVLFSNRVDDAERQQIARQLQRTARPTNFERGHPTFPVLNHRTKLVHLIGPKSWFLFESLGVGTEWLSKSVQQWNIDEDFKEAEMFVRHVKVVNDVSKRTVKLVQDFATSITNDDQQKQYLLQVVEHQRKAIPSFKKTLLATL